MKKTYQVPVLGAFYIAIEESIANSSIQFGDTDDSRPVVEDWVDEQRSDNYFFD